MFSDHRNSNFLNCYSNVSNYLLFWPNGSFPYSQLEEEGIASINSVTKIWSSGWNSHLVKSTRFTWIAVQGNDSICVVTCDKIPIGPWEPAFSESAFSEMKVHPLLGKTCCEVEYPKECAMSRPFAAVSVVQNTDQAYSDTTNGASSARFNEKEALCFLMKKMIICSDFTHEETLETAITALKCLLPDDNYEIKAWVMRKGQQIEALPIKENLKSSCQ